MYTYICYEQSFNVEIISPPSCRLPYWRHNGRPSSARLPSPSQFNSPPCRQPLSHLFSPHFPHASRLLDPDAHLAARLLVVSLCAQLRLQRQPLHRTRLTQPSQQAHQTPSSLLGCPLSASMHHLLRLPIRHHPPRRRNFCAAWLRPPPSPQTPLCSPSRAPQCYK